MLFWDGSRNFEPRSDKEDATVPLFKFYKTQAGGYSALEGINVHKSHTWRIFKELCLNLGIHGSSIPLHLEKSPVCFPPIQVDQFKRTIHGGYKMHYRPLRSPYSPPPDRVFRFLKRAPSRPRTDFSSLTATPSHISPPQSSPHTGDLSPA
ncbi:hypothetical protein AVEN_237602-1 [Araneus ventricosus]|uniref:Uncharacterized protein n=1 Tax=Araneus ventricosus TaxID=182803 RepID=A0A4Y2KZ81_ARAVE|nr:hypothetical protein AVEN_237602-1 [Araneus ventricosus]